MIITVTQSNIDNGKRGEPDCCPVALALRDEYGKGCCIFVGGKTASYPRGEIKLPDSVGKFVRDFDNNIEVQPFSFEFDDSKVERNFADYYKVSEIVKGNCLCSKDKE